MMAQPLTNIFTRHPLTAALAYGVLVGALLIAAWLAVADVIERYQAVGASTELLAQLEGRRTSPSRTDVSEAAVPVGSPFLEGQTETVAAASLLQRVTEGVTRAGGNVLSSQVELQGARSKDGFVSLIVSCEVEQAALQRLLYDLEAGMPFLFIEQLVAQAPAAATAAPDGRMRVLLAVIGQWQNGK